MPVLPALAISLFDNAITTFTTQNNATMSCRIHSGGERIGVCARKGGVISMVIRPLHKRHMSIAMIIAFCLFFSQAVSAREQEQPITITLKNASLESVFTEIRKQTGINFIYTKDLLQRAAKVSIEVRNESLQKVMELVMKDQPLTYTLLDEYVVIKKKPAPVAWVPEGPRVVKGIVTNHKGDAVMGATVSVKESKNVTFTDETGTFTLRNVNDGAVIVVTSVGYTSREVTAQSNEPLVIALQNKVNELVPVAVVVSTGYQQLSREKMVGSFSQLDSAAFHRRTGMDILTRLDGTVTGMLFQRTSNAAPITVRGISTTGMNQGGEAFSPLIILDNFPFTGSLDNINPNDIKDITVLKDAAAASIWGSRAGNGVIVISTKRGSYNQPFQVSATANLNFTEKPDLWYAPVLNSSDFIDGEIFLYSKNFYNSALNNKTNRPLVSPVVEILKRRDLGLISPDNATEQIDQLRKLELRDQLDKYVFQTALKQQYHVNMSGGSDKANYGLSIGYDHGVNNVQGTKPDYRYTLNSNNTFRPVRSLELSVGMQFSQSVNKSINFNPNIFPNGRKSTLYPYAQLADADGKAIPVEMDYRSGYTDTAGNGRLLDWKYRPLDDIRDVSRNIKTQFLRVDLGASWRFKEIVRLDLKYQYSSQNSDTREYYSLATYYARNLINRFSSISNGIVTRNIPPGGILNLNGGRSNMHNARAQASFRNVWKGIHEVNAMVAAEIGESNGSTWSSRLYGFDDELGTYANNIDFKSLFLTYGNVGGSSSIINATSEASSVVNRFVSLLANASYLLHQKYLLHASVRRDGANVFGVRTNNKWKPLWSLGAAWDISRENFYEIPWMNSLKFRASIGSAGNVSLMRSGFPSINYTNTDYYTGLSGAVPGDPPNPDLRWEVVKTMNLGVDFSLLKGRLSGTFEWFRKKSTDLISTVPVDPTSGVDMFVANSAELLGNGYEINLNSANVKGAFNWETGFGLTYNKTIVKKYYNPAGNDVTALLLSSAINPVEGKLAWGIASYKWAGLDPDNGDPRGYLNKAVSKNYSGIVLDSLQNQVFHGSSIPLYSGFLLNTFRYRGLSLSANIMYKLDYYYRLTSINYGSFANSWVAHPDYAKRWQKSGDENFTTVPSFKVPIDDARNNFYANSEVNVRRADNIRLQDIRVSYEWKPGGKRFLIERFQVYAYANNLNIFIWRKADSNQYPDVAAQGYPLQRSVTFGAMMNF